MRIRVDPDYLRETRRQISRSVAVLRSQREQLSTAWERLGVAGWEGRYRNQVEQEWRQAQSRASGLVEQAEALTRFLAERAARFEEADHTGLAVIGQMATVFAPIQQEWSQWFRPRQLASPPQVLVGRLLRLGGENQPLPICVTPGDLGKHLVGTRYLHPPLAQWRRSLEQVVETRRPAK